MVQQSRPGSAMIPGPRPTPILGARGNMLRFFRDPVGWMLRLHRDHGSVASVCQGSQALVFAFGAENNRRVVSNPALFHNNDRMLFPVPPGSSLERLTSMLVMQNGEHHQRTRRLLLPAFARTTIDAHRDSIVAIADRALGRMRPGAVVDVHREMLEITSAIVIRCMFGLEDEHDAVSLGLLGAEILACSYSPLSMLLPLDVGLTPYGRLVRATSTFEARIRALIDEKRRRGARASDALSILIHSHDADGSAFTDLDLVSQSCLLFLAGYETTSTTLAWTLFLLSQHPEVLADLGDELRGELRGDAPTSASLASLPLLDAVIKESMRVLPATPMLFVRVVSDDTALGSFALPRGAMVVVSPLVSHHQPEVFPEPRRFRPRRWETARPTPYEYLPFGVGPRMCLGAGFASLVTRLVVAMAVQRHRFTPARGATISRKVSGITMGSVRGIPMRVERPGDGPHRKVSVHGNIHDLVDLT